MIVVSCMGVSLVAVLITPTWLGRLLGQRPFRWTAFLDQHDRWRWDISNARVPWRVRRAIERELAARDKRRRALARL